MGAILFALCAAIAGLVAGFLARTRRARWIAAAALVVGLAGVACAIALEQATPEVRILGVVSQLLLLFSAGCVGPAVFARPGAATALSFVATLLLGTLGSYALLAAACHFDSFCL